MLNKSVKLFLGMMFLALVVFQDNVLADDWCDGIYSPGNPYVCVVSGGVQGNCTWWAAHFLRYGKGDRKVFYPYSQRIHGDAKDWATSAAQLGYTVVTNPGIGYIAVRENTSGTPYGHVASVVSFDSSNITVEEMNAGLTGYRTKTYARSFFQKYIVPDPQPKLFSISPQPIALPYDASYTINGENMDKVISVEIKFPNGGTGVLYGSGQIPWKTYNQLGINVLINSSGNYIFNTITDRHVEANPQMPVYFQ